MADKKDLTKPTTPGTQTIPVITKDLIEMTLESHLKIADVKSVYLEPIREGDTLIIPAAEILAFSAFGIGGGIGTIESEEENESIPSQASGGGGGGGGRYFARPAAVIIASPQGVRVEPVIDITKIALAAFTTAGFMAAMVARMLRPGRRPDL